VIDPRIKKAFIKLCRSFLTACVVPFLFTGCFVDFQTGASSPQDGAVDGAADGSNPTPDGTADGSNPTPDGTTPPDGVAWPDGASTDALPSDGAPTCTEGRLRCNANGTADYCENNAWYPLGHCFFMCSGFQQKCTTVSNVAYETLNVNEGSLNNAAWTADEITIHTATGLIYDEQHSETIRPAGANSVQNGIGFYTVTQGVHQPTLGVFVFSNLEIASNVTVRAQGTNALVILSLNDVVLNGVLDGGAQGQASGPGGFAGGDPYNGGTGPGGGLPGEAEQSQCTYLCASGGGGGSYGGTGGSGGAVNCGAVDLPSGVGGSSYGNQTLVPLVGGSGGAGGMSITSHQDANPGAGGGGGGAVQISARSSLTIGPDGGITVPGGGGGPTTSGSGSGGGAGGAILLESPTIDIQSGAFVAANGGGGGGGDCS
jgi:hypothetical protein